MKRSVIIGSVCALLTVGVAWATQVWRDNTDGGNHSLANVSTIQANNGIGSGTRCAQFDSAGNLQPNATACGAGLGGSSGVSSVTGTAQHISATPTTGAVVVDTIGGYSTGAVTGGNVSMGAFASGVDEQVTTAGQAAPFTYQCVAGEVQYGAASAGALAQSSSLTWDDSTHRLFVGAYINFLAAGAPGTPAVGHGDLYEDNVSANIAFKNGAGTVNHGAQTQASVSGVALTGLADNGSWTTQSFQAPLIACTDYVSLSCVSGATDLGGTNATPTVIGIENTATMRGDVVATAVTAPSTPAAGKGAIYEDSTSKNIALKNDAGTVNHGIQTKTCGGSQWVNAISDAGGAACVQPAFTDVNGSLACAQLPALTGGVTSSAGSCATTVASVACAALPALTGAVTSSAGSCATTLASLAGKTPQTMYWAWNLPTSLALSNRFMCEGNYDTGTATCNQYPVLQSFTHVTMTLNVTVNSCTGGGTPLFQVNLFKNGSGLVNVPVNCGVTGIVTTGSVAFAASAGDVIGFVYDGTLFGTGAGGGTSAFVTARFDP